MDEQERASRSNLAPGQNHMGQRCSMRLFIDAIVYAQCPHPEADKQTHKTPNKNNNLTKQHLDATQDLFTTY